MRSAEPRGEERLVRVAAGPVTLEGNLSLPERARGIVLFAHGSGSSRHSPRNRYVARVLNEAKLATLLVDLLTPDEEAVDLRTAHLRFDIGLLAGRLVGVTDWLTQYPDTRELRIGYFGASTGAAAALVAAAQRPDAVGASQPLHVEPKGEVSRMYGAYREGDGTSERALFVLDQEAVIHWSYVSPVGVNPGAAGILRALEELTERRVAS
jgi:dipeptidyl aminopeptidase/acylaminoacyl peptidase